MNSKQCIFLFGPPGCGKGTQASFIKSFLNCSVITTGDLLRSEVNSKSALGEKISSIMKSGSLVDPDIVEKLTLNAVQNASSDIIMFDGYPRSIEQFYQLEKISQQCNLSYATVLNFVIPIENLVSRITNRFFCQDCGEIYHKITKNTTIEGVCDVCGSTNLKTRSDDNEITVIKRFNVFQNETMPVLDHFGSVVVNIDATRDIDVINSEIKNIFSKLSL